MKGMSMHRLAIVALASLASLLVPPSAQATFGRTAGTFAVSPTGAATYSIPVWVPPGPRGLQPAIRIAYSSSAGLSTLGTGWSIAGLSAITRDVPPFMIVEGHPAAVRTVNKIGLKRRGFDEQRLEQLKTAWKMLFSDTTPLITQAVELEKKYPDSEDIRTLVAFMRRSMAGKSGRAREALRGTFLRDDNDEETPHATGN